jgi:hypothetical protein
VRLLVSLLLITLTSCIIHQKDASPTREDTLPARSIEFQKEIDRILAVDAENKKWERVYLSEIAIAQENDDQDAYKFFIVEYINIPRLILPGWLKNEPGYVKQVSAEEILREKFMNLQLP